MMDETVNSFVKGTHLRKILERTGPFCAADFEVGDANLNFLANDCRVLVLGCGGLGCELLPKLALMGFNQIDVIDMDTIDLSNLNRQFLFRHKDIGKSKAEVAAEYINNKLPGVRITPHFCKIQEKNENFYRQFHIIISGLDSVIARRWINGMLISLLQYDEKTNQLDKTSIIPLIDGGFKGNVRVILPGETACIECTLSLFPPQVNFPLCTIANTPRLPEHCIEYAKVLLWPKENPFGGNETAIDTDDPNHINWLYERALERAKQFNIEGVTYRLTSGVIKNIIPAVASTNALIAASCVTEAFKLATSCHETMNNYMIFNDTVGIYTYTYQQERNAQCIACSPANVVKTIAFKFTDKLQDVIDFFCQSSDYQMKAPCLTTTNSDGSNRTLYMQSVPSLEQITRPNLVKSLKQLKIEDGQNLFVADSTTPNTMTFKLDLL